MPPVSESGTVDPSEGALESDFQKRMDESWVRKRKEKKCGCLCLVLDLMTETNIAFFGDFRTEQRTSMIL